jgi:hypothetical protein
MTPSPLFYAPGLFGDEDDPDFRKLNLLKPDGDGESFPGLSLEGFNGNMLAADCGIAYLIVRLPSSYVEGLCEKKFRSGGR